MKVARPVQGGGVGKGSIHRHLAGALLHRAVIIPGFHDGLLPLEGSDLREEQNLAFVGLTRAKDQLVLTMSRAMPMSPLLAGVPLTPVRWP